MAGPDEKPDGGLDWRKDVLGNVPGVLLVGAALMYGYLSICYDRFYGSLGVDPNDVGLSYTGTLARSSGFVAIYLVVLYLLLTPILGSIAEWRARRSRFDSAVLFLIASAMLFGVMILLPVVAKESAEDVMRGEGVAPIYPLTTSLPPILAIRADPAIVEPAGMPEEVRAAKQLRDRKLLYLGQANSTVVLYDSDANQAIYVPASSIILRVTNCDVKPLPDRCPRPMQPAPA